MLDSSSPKLDRSELLNSELLIGCWLNSSNWRNSNCKPNSYLIPTLSLDDPLAQPWEILSEATPSRAPDITMKPKLLPWYEMMTTHAELRRRRGEGVRSHISNKCFAPCFRPQRITRDNTLFYGTTEHKFVVAAVLDRMCTHNSGIRYDKETWTYYSYILISTLYVQHLTAIGLREAKRRHWTEHETTPPCWRYSWYEQKVS